jgi:hypothetical protein
MSKLVWDLGLGAAIGYGASRVMDLATGWFYQGQSPASRRHEQEVAPGSTPAVVGKKLAGLAGRDVTDAQAPRISLILHRSLAVWSTLRAYGRRGYEALIDRSLALAQRMAERVDAAPDLERLADVPLNIVCFRFNSGGTAEEELNRINDRLGQAILEDGRFYAGTTLYGEKVALRPAIVNWRTTEQEIDLFIDVVRELGARVALNT